MVERPRDDFLGICQQNGGKETKQQAKQAQIEKIRCMMIEVNRKASNRPESGPGCAFTAASKAR